MGCLYDLLSICGFKFDSTSFLVRRLSRIDLTCERPEHSVNSLTILGLMTLRPTWVWVGDRPWAPAPSHLNSVGLIPVYPVCLDSRDENGQPHHIYSRACFKVPGRLYQVPEEVCPPGFFCCCVIFDDIASKLF